MQRALPAILVVAVLGNVGIAWKFQSGTSHSLRWSESTDLAHLVDSTYPLMRQTYGIYADLALIGNGEQIVLPPDHPLDLGLLRFLAGVTPVVVEAPNPTELGGLPAASLTGRLLVGEATIGYSVISDGGDGPLRAAFDGADLVVAPASLFDPPVTSE